MFGSKCAKPHAAIRLLQRFCDGKDGQHKNSINLKRRGTAPLVDLIRVHALAVGSRAQNSFERLDDIIDAGILPKGRAQDLKRRVRIHLYGTNSPSSDRC